MKQPPKNMLCTRDEFGNSIYWLDGKGFLAKIKKRTPERLSNMITMIERSGFEIIKMKKEKTMILFTVENKFVTNNKYQKELE